MSIGVGYVFLMLMVILIKDMVLRATKYFDL